MAENQIKNKYLISVDLPDELTTTVIEKIPPKGIFVIPNLDFTSRIITGKVHDIIEIGGDIYAICSLTQPLQLDSNMYHFANFGYRIKRFKAGLIDLCEILLFDTPLSYPSEPKAWLIKDTQ